MPPTGDGVSKLGSREEGIAAIARETGWSLEYIQGLNDYWRLIILGWRPKRPEDDPKAITERMKRMSAMVGRQGGTKPRG